MNVFALKRDGGCNAQYMSFECLYMRTWPHFYFGVYQIFTMIAVGLPEWRSIDIKLPV